MGNNGSGALSPRKRRTRRYGFLALLLLALAAPAGFVAAGETTQPYVVLFRDDAVRVADDVANLALSGARLPFRDAARPAAAPLSSASAARIGVGGATRIDSQRVESHVREIAARAGLARIGSVYTSAVGGFAADLTAAQLARVSDDPVVGAVLPDVEISLDEGAGDVVAGGIEGGIRTTGDPTTRVPPGIRRVGARSSQGAGVTGRGTRVNADVALIDTGIQRDHPDLNVVGGYNCTGRKRDKWDDDEGHGTHVAGIVGALDNNFGVTGVAPGVRLWSVKVLNSRGHGFLSWVVCGVDWVTAQRDPANHSRPLIEVANMSLSFSLPGARDADCGRPNNDTLHMAICQSVAKGTTYVVAAGNESHNARRNRPAAYDEVITVSAMADYDGRPGGRGRASDSCPYWSPERDDSFARFSNYGPDVDLIAPGKCVLSTYKGGRYAWMSGTSMASPHVAGVAALYKSMFPRATPEQVRMGLTAVARLDWRTSSDPDGSHEPAVFVGNFRVMPDFALNVPESTASQPGGAVSVRVRLSRSGGFNDPITVSLAAGPKGVSSSQGTVRRGNVTLSVQVADRMKPGRYTLTIRGASGDVVHNAQIELVVGGRAPKASFSSPAGGETAQSSTSVRVAWSESGAVAARRLTREAGRVRTPGTCADVRFSVDRTRSVSSPTVESVRPGFCYRWQLTLTDASGAQSSTYSGSVLVDASAPPAPSVSLSGSIERRPNLASLAIGQAYVAGAGMLWVRAGVSGSVAVQVSAGDPESGIAANVAGVEGGRGWSPRWIGASADGSLLLRYGSSGSSARLSVRSVNGAGLTGPTTTAQLLRDGTAPEPVSWLSARPGATRLIKGSYFRLDWGASSDQGSGLAERFIVGRYRADLKPNGECRTNGFSPDGEFRLVTNHSWESGLQPSTCYVWSIRALDNVGNTSASAVSGYVITR